MTCPPDKSSSSIFRFRKKKDTKLQRYSKKIGYSLASALRRLRQRHKSVTLWVDALCINQDNDLEKSQQVTLMTRIYSSATMVQAWLGPRLDEDSHTRTQLHIAFDFINDLADTVNACHFSSKIYDNLAWLDACRLLAMRAEQGRTTQANEVEAFCDDLWNQVHHVLATTGSWQAFLSAFQTLSRVQYFSRIWILQECITAQAQTFRYGDRSAPRHILFLLLCLASGSPAAAKPGNVVSSPVRFDMRFFDCVLVRNCKTLKDILELMYFSRASVREATEPEDLIWGVVGLSKDSELPVEIGLSPEMVYTRTAQVMLTQGFTDLLIGFKPYNAPAKMSSWVYDWRTRGMATFATFQACGETTAQISFRQNLIPGVPHALQIRGSRLGYITDAGHHFSAIATQAGFSKDAIGTGLWRDHRKPTTAAQDAELRRLITGVHKSYHSIVTDSDLADLSSDPDFPATSFWLWWIQWTTRLWQFTAKNQGEKRHGNVHFIVSELLTRGQSNSIAVANKCASLVDLHRWTKPSPAGLRELESLYRYAWGMRPVAIGRDFVGYAAESAEVGDEVVIFDGVKAPLVIRKSGGEARRIVGPAYICGVMQGEFITADRGSFTYTMV